MLAAAFCGVPGSEFSTWALLLTWLHLADWAASLDLSLLSSIIRIFSKSRQLNFFSNVNASYFWYFLVSLARASTALCSMLLMKLDILVFISYLRGKSSAFCGYDSMIVTLVLLCVSFTVLRNISPTCSLLAAFNETLLGCHFFLLLEQSCDFCFSVLCSG